MIWVLLSIPVGRWQVRRLASRARPLQDVNWTRLLRETSETLDLRRPAVLLQAADNPMPVTWGAWRPVVLVPAEADGWAVERRRVVLLHELAHAKRWDCLTQMVASVVCALYWFNPLVWAAARRMRIERERACDDLVLRGGCAASDYASHLVDIARSFRRSPHLAAIAIARSSQLEGRIAAIVDKTRTRTMPRAFVLSLFYIVLAGVVGAIAAQKPQATQRAIEESNLLRERQITRLQEFSRAKEKQSLALAAKAGESILPEYRRFFDAATNGDWQVVTEMYADFKRRHPQYDNRHPDLELRTSYWSPVLEISLAYYDVTAGEPKYIQMAVDDIINSIPTGSIYFGGTDPGRGLITAFCKSHAEADPFFTLTQNALADGSYLEYLRSTYGGKIYTPSEEDSQTCYDEYVKDAQRRLVHDRRFPNEPRQLKPGEDVKEVDGKPHVQGQVAVMAINASLAKRIFEKNPNREFYIEESFPLDWMYPHLTPNGFVMKINREALAELSEAIIQRDRKFWRGRVDGMIGPWLTEETPVQTVTEFAERVYGRKNVKGFEGDMRFLRNENAQKMFSKWRSAIGGVYAWRISNPKNPADQQRMLAEADFAFRQALALSPSSPEAVFRYVNLLIAQGRVDEGFQVVQAAVNIKPNDKQFKGLLEQIEQIRKASRKK